MIGNKINQLLLSSEKSAKDLAAYTGVTVQAVYQWLNDEVTPRTIKKERIASFFGISLQALEYGPVLSLSSPKSSKLGELPLYVAESTVDLMIEAELQGRPSKSPEFRLGLRHELLRSLSSFRTPTPYSEGTCQLDAYLSGVDCARAMIDRIKP